MPGLMTIGQLARSVGLKPRTIRFYEQLGLLPAPARTAAGYRMYGDDAVQGLRFVLKCKLIGLTLEEIARILAIRSGGVAPCRHVLELIDQKLSDIARQRRELQSLESELAALRAEADAAMTRESRFCSIIEHHALHVAPADPASRASR